VTGQSGDVRLEVNRRVFRCFLKVFRVLQCRTSVESATVVTLTLGSVIFQHTSVQWNSTEGQQLVSPLGKGPIPPDQALYKVKCAVENSIVKCTVKSCVKRC